MSVVREKFCPAAVACQCGADGVAGDPLACFNLTQQVLSHCVQYLMQFNVPLVLLGGGMCSHDYIIICPIAIAYSMGQIIKSVCVCQSVYLSVCEHSHGRIS